MGFPNIFYCVCEVPSCVWNRPGHQAFGRVVVEVGQEGVHRYIEPDDRPARIVGSPYWNTCKYYRIILFEAIFVRALRELVQSGVTSLDALPEVLDHLVWKPRLDPEFRRVHERVISKIGAGIYHLEREVGMMNGRLVEIIQLVRYLVNYNRALLDEGREPHYWPSRVEMRAIRAGLELARQQRLEWFEDRVRDGGPPTRVVQSLAGRAAIGERVA